MSAMLGAAGLGGPHCRVLIIEDDSDSADTLREALEFYGHEIAVALSASEGVSKARELQPDVVVCDIGLPDTDGYSVARLLRAEERLRNTCLVALSGYASPIDLENGKRAGFTHQFTKPLAVESLQQLLRDFCAGRDTAGQKKREIESD